MSRPIVVVSRTVLRADDVVEDGGGRIAVVVAVLDVVVVAVLDDDVGCVAVACVSSRPRVQLRRTCRPTWRTAVPNCTDS